jgi:hypothetical protein
MVDVWNTTEFTITDEHLKLSRRMYVSWDDCEYGAPAIDCKRPYGNSYVEGDMLEILDIEDPRKREDYDGDEWDDIPEDIERRLNDLHHEMQVVLQIWLASGMIRTGTFVKKDKYDFLSWILKE